MVEFPEIGFELCDAGSVTARAYRCYAFATTGASSGFKAFEGCSSVSFSQSHPSLIQACTVPIFDFFSTMKGAPHFGHGSAIGMYGVVKSQSGYREHP